MKSIRELFRIGFGPSSSHTIGPHRAAVSFLADYPTASSFRVTLFGSLAATGRGHLTDQALQKTFLPLPVEIIWRPEEEVPQHPNSMRLEALTAQGTLLGSIEEFGVGGGALLSDQASKDLYPQQTMAEILGDCLAHGDSLAEVVERHEGPEIWPFLKDIWEAMLRSIDQGLHREGLLPGELRLPRRARSLHRRSLSLDPRFRDHGQLAAFSYAVSEENASGGRVVTAPTCGSSGVLPSVLHWLQTTFPCSEVDILRSLATAGLVGNVIKHNGSISGAMVGCQGEIGAACAMAAAAATQFFGGTVRQVEYAAEMGLEHHLGLTCDPVAGLVQIPCIERNAHAAVRAISCCQFSLLSDGAHRISFDEVVAVIMETGCALPKQFRETSTGGLARIYSSRMGLPIPNTRC